MRERLERDIDRFEKHLLEDTKSVKTQDYIINFFEKALKYAKSKCVCGYCEKFYNPH